jgi:hypothetical protein
LLLSSSPQVRRLEEELLKEESQQREMAKRLAALEQAEARAEAALRAEEEAEQMQEALEEEMRLLEQQKALAQEERALAAAQAEWARSGVVPSGFTTQSGVLEPEEHDEELEPEPEPEPVRRMRGFTSWRASKGAEDASDEDAAHGAAPVPARTISWQEQWKAEQAAVQQEQEQQRRPQQQSDMSIEDRAAVKIQAKYRSRLVRRRLATVKLERELMATKLQANYRGHVVRKQLTGVRQDLAEAEAEAYTAEVAASQARARAGEAQARHKLQLEEQHEQDAQSQERNSAATKIAAVYRGNDARKRSQRTSPAVPTLVPASSTTTEGTSFSDDGMGGSMTPPASTGQNEKLQQSKEMNPNELSPSRIPRLSPDIKSRSPGRSSGSRLGVGAGSHVVDAGTGAAASGTGDRGKRPVTPSRLPVRRRTMGAAEAIRARLAAAGHESFAQPPSSHKMKQQEPASSETTAPLRQKLQPKPESSTTRDQKTSSRGARLSALAEPSQTPQQRPQSAREKAKARRSAKSQRKARTDDTSEPQPASATSKDQQAPQEVAIPLPSVDEGVPPAPLDQVMVEQQPIDGGSPEGGDDEPPPLTALPWEHSPLQQQQKHQDSGPEESPSPLPPMLRAEDFLPDVDAAAAPPDKQQPQLQEFDLHTTNDIADDDEPSKAAEAAIAAVVKQERRGETPQSPPSPTPAPPLYPGLAAGLEAYGSARPNTVSALQRAQDDFELLFSEGLEELCAAMPEVAVWSETTASAMDGSPTLAPGEAGKRVQWEALMLELHDGGRSALATHWLRRGSEKAGSLSAKKSRLLVLDAIEWLRGTATKYLKRGCGAPFESFLARAERVIQDRTGAEEAGVPLDDVMAVKQAHDLLQEAVSLAFDEAIDAIDPDAVSASIRQALPEGQATRDRVVAILLQGLIAVCNPRRVLDRARAVLALPPWDPGATGAAKPAAPAAPVAPVAPAAPPAQSGMVAAAAQPAPSISSSTRPSSKKTSTPTRARPPVSSSSSAANSRTKQAAAPVASRSRDSSSKRGAPAAAAAEKRKATPGYMRERGSAAGSPARSRGGWAPPSSSSQRQRRAGNGKPPTSKPTQQGWQH